MAVWSGYFVNKKIACRHQFGDTSGDAFGDTLQHVASRHRMLRVAMEMLVLSYE